MARSRGALLTALLLTWLVPTQVCSADPPPDNLARMAHHVLPAVVTITASGVPLENDDESDPGGSAIRELLGDVMSAARRLPVASGVILEASGLVVTAAHAVQGIQDLEAVTADGVSHKVTIVGSDPRTDLAVLQMAGDVPFSAATLGDSSTVQPGDWVVAIGTPYGLGASVTGGIISAVERPRPVSPVDDLLQTDAATFTDSAGGPLVNERGEVIGLTTVLTAHEFGISFALPSNTVRRIVPMLVRDGLVARGSLDVRVQPLTPGLAKALRVPGKRGVIIAELSSRGAAAKAGLRLGDVITRLGGRPLETAYDVERVLLNSVPAQSMDLAYWRQGRVGAVRVVLGLDLGAPVVEQPFSSPIATLLRFEVRPLTPELGVVVSRVRMERSAEEQTLKAGDIVREINGQPVRTVADFERIADAVKPGEWIALLVQRGRTAVFVGVQARGDWVSTR